MVEDSSSLEVSAGNIEIWGGDGWGINWRPICCDIIGTGIGIVIDIGGGGGIRMNIGERCDGDIGGDGGINIGGGIADGICIGIWLETVGLSLKIWPTFPNIWGHPVRNCSGLNLADEQPQFGWFRSGLLMGK